MMIRRWAILGALCFLVGCSDPTNIGIEPDIGIDTDSGERVPDIEDDVDGEASSPRQGWTRNQRFYVVYTADTAPLPFQQLFSLRVLVYEDSTMQRPVRGATIGFRARVHEFMNPLTTRPVITSVGD